MRKVLGAAILAAFSCVPACTDASLSEDAVTSIPPGSAKGTAFSGTREVTWVTTDCDGDCFPVRITETQIFTVCDRGFRQTTTATFAQENGALVMDVEGSSFVSRLRGGVNGDGTFEVGGVRTELSGTFTMRARMSGLLQTAGGGSARVKVVTTPRTPRDAGILSTNCTSVHELTFAPPGPVVSGAPPAPDGG